jgi:hypothetical protein
MKDLKKEYKKVLAGLLFIIFIYSISIYFQLAWYWIWCIIMGFITALMVYKKSFKLTSWVKTGITIAVIMLVFRFLGGYGTLGFIAIVVLAVIYILLKKRKEYVSVKHTIESQIWGKPLKEFVEKKERLPKIKISGLRKSS